MPPTELLPCPWCGNDHALTVDNLVGDDWYVECGACKVQQHAIYRTFEAAIAAWNRRAPALVSPAPDDKKAMGVLLELVNEQAEDDGLWFIAATATEAYLQAALRRLHAAVEQTSSDEEKT